MLPPPATLQPTGFYGRMELDPVRAMRDLGDVIDGLGTPYGGAFLLSWLIFWAAVRPDASFGGGGRAIQAGDDRLGRRALRLPEAQLAILAYVSYRYIAQRCVAHYRVRTLPSGSLGITLLGARGDVSTAGTEWVGWRRSGVWQSHDRIERSIVWGMSDVSRHRGPTLPATIGRQRRAGSAGEGAG